MSTTPQRPAAEQDLVDTWLASRRAADDADALADREGVRFLLLLKLTCRQLKVLWRAQGAYQDTCVVHTAALKDLQAARRGAPKGATR